MTAKELSVAIGCEGLYAINKLEVAVNVIDARMSYGRAQLQIEPLKGAGKVWVDASSVVLDEALPTQDPFSPDAVSAREFRRTE